MIKAAFFDVDGTLFSHRTGQIPASTKQAFKELHAAGIKTFTATGRHILELNDLPTRELTFDGYVTLNGQLGLDGQQKIIFDTPIDPVDVRIVIKEFNKKDLPISVVEDDRIFINFINQDVKQTLANILSPLPAVGKYDGRKKIYQFMTYDAGPRARALVAKLPDCKLTQWNPLGFDIVPQNGSKMVGIKKMMRHFDLKQSEIIAFGDGANDLEMLKYAGVSVAMGNGIQEIKQAADHVTSDIDQDGIYQALKFYHVI